MSASASEVVEVHLLQMPVTLWARAIEHNDELLREFALMEADGQADTDAGVPARLVALMATIRAQYGGATDAKRAELFAAVEAGRSELDDVLYRLPPAAAAAAQELARTLDEADAYCRDGQHLLTLATPPDVVAFRHWYLTQIVDQIAGRPPLPWPDYAGS